MAGRKPRYKVTFKREPDSNQETSWGSPKSSLKAALCDARSHVTPRVSKFWGDWPATAYKSWVTDLKTGRKWELSND